MNRNVRIAKQLVKLAKMLVAAKNDNYAEPATLNHTDLVIGDGNGNIMIFISKGPAYHSLDNFFDYDENSIRQSEGYKTGSIDDEDIECALRPDGYTEYCTSIGNFSSAYDFEQCGFKLKPGLKEISTSGNGYNFNIVFSDDNKPDQEWLDDLPYNFDSLID